MGYQYAFEKLTVWNDAKELILLIYSSTSGFPDEEKFGLISQMRRCSISVCSNLAEGSTRKTVKDQAHFYTLAYSSLIDLLNQSIISRELSFISDEKHVEIREKIEKLSYKINSLRNSRMNKNR